MMTVLYEWQEKGWIADASELPPKIESIHAALMPAIPDDGMLQADISGEFE
jgi:hypothetical protein